MLWKKAPASGPTVLMNASRSSASESASRTRGSSNGLRCALGITLMKVGVGRRSTVMPGTLRNVASTDSLGKK